MACACHPPTAQARMRRFLAIPALALLLHSAPVHGEAIRQPRATPSDVHQRALFRDVADGRLDELPLLRAALVASGVADSSKLDTYADRFTAATQRLQREAAYLSSDHDRAATVLSALHREFLTGRFEPHCQSIATTLDTGRHNCVTATLLFAALAETIHLPVVTLHAPGHVRVRVGEVEPFEIEPTCADWFRRTDRRLLVWQAEPRELSATALIAKLYYNQGVVALEQRQFSDAIIALDSSLLLDPVDQDARQNLLAALNNGALELCAKRDFVPAAALIRNAMQLDPHYAPLAANELHLLGQWTLAHCESRDFAAALAVVQQAEQRYPESDLARGGSAAVHRLWAESLLRSGEAHAALARVEAGLITAPTDSELLRLKDKLTRHRQ